MDFFGYHDYGAETNDPQIGEIGRCTGAGPDCETVGVGRVDPYLEEIREVSIAILCDACYDDALMSI